MAESTLVFTLALVTLGIVVLFGLWQLVRARQARRNNERSAMSDHPGGRMSANRTAEPPR